MRTFCLWPYPFTVFHYVDQFFHPARFHDWVGFMVRNQFCFSRKKRALRPILLHSSFVYRKALRHAKALKKRQDKKRRQKEKKQRESAARQQAQQEAADRTRDDAMAAAAATAPVEEVRVCCVCAFPSQRCSMYTVCIDVVVCRSSVCVRVFSRRCVCVLPIGLPRDKVPLQTARRHCIPWRHHDLERTGVPPNSQLTTLRYKTPPAHEHRR